MRGFSFAVVLAVGCAASAPSVAPEAARGVGSPSPAPAPLVMASVPAGDAAPPAVPPDRSGRPCGDLGCRLFASPSDALLAALADEPQILGIGEAHALLGSEAVEPAVRRFGRDLLPLLKGRASDLVIELLVPNPKCQKESRQAAAEQKVVTENQAKTNQNDYVALGEQARALGIRAHALRPTCEDLTGIAGAGPDAIAASLDVITRLSRELLSSLAQGNESRGDARVVLAYGGAMHNDVAPRAGREAWSYGPALSKAARYVELDLVVPEFVKETPAWRALPWFAAWDPAAHPDETTLFAPLPASFVLVFPSSPK